MAKRKVNKSQAVRDYLSEHPGAKPAEIVKALAKKRITVSRQQVSQIKSKSKTSKIGKASKTSKTSKISTTSNGKVNVSDLITTKRFAEQVGGVENARELVAVLGELG